MADETNNVFLVDLLFHVGYPKEEDLNFSYTGQYTIDMNIKNQKSEFSDAWLAVLGTKLPMKALKIVLVNIHAKIIPFLTSPALLIDFLTDSFKSKGSIALLAINGLFTLVQEHGV